MKFCLTNFLFAPLALIAAATNAPPALVPAYGEIAPTFWEQHEILVSIGGITLLVLTTLAVWKIMQPKPAVILPPEVVAREALNKLLQQPEDGKLLSEVSQVLRGYGGAVFQIPGAELTTAEFCIALMQIEKNDPSLRESISNFLRECDVRKFSTADGTAPSNTVSRALEIVVRVEEKTHRRDAGATTK